MRGRINAFLVAGSRVAISIVVSLTCAVVVVAAM